MSKKRKILENGRLFGKVSLVDLFVVVLVIGLALMVYFRFTAGQDSVNVSNGDDKITFEMKITPVRHYSADMLHVGDKVYVAKGECIGQITDIRTEQATDLYSTLDGRIVRMPIEDKLCVYLTVEGTGRYMNDAYFLTDTLELRIYDFIYVYTKEVNTSGTVVSISVEEGEK